MSETEKELWGVIDNMVFGSNDPDQILERFERAFERRQAKQSTFGGYLRSLRRDYSATPATLALQAGIGRDVWQSWEENRTIPKQAELERVCRNLKLGEDTVSKLFELRSRLPHTILTRLSHYRPDQLVASGAGVVEAKLEWRKLPPGVQQLLARWAEAHDLRFPEDFLNVLFELKTPEEQERWVAEVLGASDVE